MLPKRIKPKYKDAAARTLVEATQRPVDRDRGERPAISREPVPLTIRKLTNRDGDFYTLIGPYLAHRTVHKELGGPPWDDPGKRWYIAVDPAGELLGFGAVTVEKAAITFCSSWVRAEKRCGGVYAALLDARIADYGKATVRARCTALSKAALEARGFTVAREVGQYFEMERKPKP